MASFAVANGLRALPGRASHCTAVCARAMSTSSGAPEETYTERQDKTGRPVSPHVGIYKFPVAALSSIANRGTGIALVVGAYGIGVASLMGADPALIASSLGNAAYVGPAAKLAVSFPLVYHYLGGLRHTIWDHMPETVQVEGVATSSYVVIGASALVSLGLAAC